MPSGPGGLCGLARVLFHKLALSLGFCPGLGPLVLRHALLGCPLALACFCMFVCMFGPPHTGQSLHLCSRALLEGACSRGIHGSIMDVPCEARRDPGAGCIQTPPKKKRKKRKQKKENRNGRSGVPVTDAFGLWSGTFRVRGVVSDWGKGLITEHNITINTTRDWVPWVARELGPLLQTTGHKVKTQGITPSSGMKRGDQGPARRGRPP